MGINEVKAHPTRYFRDVFVAIGEKYIPNTKTCRLFALVTLIWRKIFRVDIKEKIIINEFSSGRDGFRPKYWLFNNFCYLDYNATFVLNPTGETSPARMAAKMLHGSLAFRKEVLEDTLPVEFEKNMPLDMGIYWKLFSRVAITTHLNGRYIQEDVDFTPTDYVVVCVHGFMYRLPCLKEGQPVSYEALYSRISMILDHAQSRSEKEKEQAGLFGLLTCLVNKRHGRIHQALIKNNAQEIKTINEALFTLSIDLESTPQTPDETLRTINADNYLNRDHRRSMYLVVTRNGRGGVTVNPHTGVGGAVTARFADYLHAHAKTLDTTPPTRKPLQHNNPNAAEPINLTIEKQWMSVLSVSNKSIQDHLYPLDEQTVFTISNVGHKDFRDRKVSSDAAFHCALNMAYLRSFGRKPVTTNFISLRNFKHGDIWRYTSSTEEMGAFLSNPNCNTMHAAIEAHRKLIKVQKMATDEFYHAGMMMLKLVSEFHLPFAAVSSLIIIMRLFIGDFGRRFLWADIWASNIPTKPGVEMAGRASVLLSFIPRESIAGHYMIYDDHINVCFVLSLKRKRDLSIGKRFIHEMENCLDEMKKMAELNS